MTRRTDWLRRMALPVLVLAGAAPLVTTASCDSARGLATFFRDDDYGDYYYEPVYDCGILFCDEYYYDDYYYEDDYYFDGYFEF